MDASDCFDGDVDGGLPVGGAWTGTGGEQDFTVAANQPRTVEFPLTLEREDMDQNGRPRYIVREDYTASDGELCALRVTVTLPTADRERAMSDAADYFQQYGRRVVESAKAAGQWPLPDEHPNGDE